MKTAVVALFLFFSAVVCYAQDPQVGTWKLNSDKSKFPLV